MFQDGSDRSDKQHDPGDATSGEVGRPVILDTGPAGRLPFPEELACLLAGPRPIVPTLVALGHLGGDRAVRLLPTISRTISLSFQSSFHLSLTVLVRYRSRANIQL